jgi:hypothetical protein
MTEPVFPPQIGLGNDAPRSCPEEGRSHCSGNRLEICAEGAWLLLQACGQCGTCVDDGGFANCRPSSCCEGEFRCSNGGLERCSENHSAWDLIELCGNPAQCDATLGRCTSAVCEPGSVRCNGARLERCNPSGLDWQLFTQCASPCLCVIQSAGGVCLPPGCSPGEALCEGGQLSLCNNCQTAFELRQDCGSVEACDAERGRCAAPTPDAGNVAP